MTNQVNDLATSFVAMAKAFEELPYVQAQLEQAQNERNEYQALVARREESILRLKAELEATHEAKRKVEAERDDAETRFLEADDKALASVRAMRNIVDQAERLIEVVQPPKPEPMPIEAKPEGQSAVDPTSTDASATPQPTLSGEATYGASTVEASSDPGPAIGTDFHLRGDPTNVDSVSSGPDSEVSPAPADPTVQATSTNNGPDAPSTGAASTETASAPTTPEQSSGSGNASGDDVGYHNEPSIGSSSPSDWQAWDAWATKMNDRFGPGQWPARPVHPNVF